MIARITTFQAQEGKLDEALAIIHDEIAPIVRQREGFQGIAVLCDRARSSGQVITYWESDAQVRAMEAEGFWQKMVSHTIYLIAAVPQLATYEVALRE